MLATLLSVAAPSQMSALPVLAALPMAPVTILLLCVFSGVATVFMLPGHREATIRNVSGVLLIALGLIFAASVPSWLPGGHGEAVYFWIFSAIAIVGAVRVVTHARPV
jgi:hypothetical protein